AALVAARQDKKKIDMSDIDEATDRVIAGPAKKSRVISKKERNIVAYHEAGHTIIGVVLDEADEMLNMGFIEDIEKILSNVPENHQTLLFSATMPDPIRRIAEK
ncbi:DEAD/DEAH box helicase, partial [Escherichia coli]|nr:DEAD/DEAH box helicase [Escherichia coli]